MFQKVEVYGFQTNVRAYLSGTWHDPVTDEWGKSAGDKYVDVVYAGGVSSLDLNLWQYNGKGGPDDKDFYGIWVSGYPSPLDWYGDVKISGGPGGPPPAGPPLGPITCPTKKKESPRLPWISFNSAF